VRELRGADGDERDAVQRLRLAAEPVVALLIASVAARDARTAGR
jgi:hypothetical protein